VLFVAAVLTQLLPAGGGPVRHLKAPALVWPVTWLFYTDSAHREYVVLYRAGQNGRLIPVSHPVADSEYHWGLGHSAYADLTALLVTASAIPPQAWRPCPAAGVNDCAAVISAAPRTAVRSDVWVPAGPAVLAVERPAGWHEGSSRRVVRVAAVDLARSG
jgi:hypothetical protein